MNQSRCVFLVETDPQIAGLLASYLRAEGFIPCTFSDGRVAVAAVRNDSPAAAIVNVGLSGMRAAAICNAMREVSAVAILVMTDCIDEADIVRSSDCRADGYVSKPYRPREIIGQLHQIIHRSKSNAAGDSPPCLRGRDAERKAVTWQGQLDQCMLLPNSNNYDQSRADPSRATQDAYFT